MRWYTIQLNGELYWELTKRRNNRGTKTKGKKENQNLKNIGGS